MAKKRGNQEVAKAADADAAASGKQQKLFQPVAVKFEPAETIHSANLKQITAVTKARDEILHHPVFSDILSAAPLTMEEGNHKAHRG